LQFSLVWNDRETNPGQISGGNRAKEKAQKNPIAMKRVINFDIVAKELTDELCGNLEAGLNHFLKFNQNSSS